MFDYFRSHGLNQWAQQLEAASRDWLLHHGDYARWSAALEALPDISNPRGVFDAAAVAVEGDLCRFGKLTSGSAGFDALA